MENKPYTDKTVIPGAEYTAGAALSTTGRADRPSYRERIRKILEAALTATG